MSSAANRLKIGLSACFSHADPTRSLFTGKTLQYVEQSIAHWIMSAGAMVVMVPCPTGETQRGDGEDGGHVERGASGTLARQPVRLERQGHVDIS